MAGVGGIGRFWDIPIQDQATIEVAMINSDLHVFTRLGHRLLVPSPQDLEN